MDGEATAPFDPEATLPPRLTSVPRPSPRLGDFGDYELLCEIARGGMGVVYRARQKSLNRIVALKMILSGEHADFSTIKRFQAEAEAAAGLNHPHVLPVYHVGELNDQPFFSMKLVEGGSLCDRIPALLRDPVAAASLVAKLARAMGYAHAHGVLHRDLKPSNILLDADGTPFITDFGLAKRVGSNDGLTKTGAIVGTPNYMAPEQARGEKDLSPAVDVYSLGAILFELITGQPPFSAATMLDTVLEVLEKEPPDPRSLRPGADRGLGYIALKCLAKEGSERYANAGELADDLDRWLAGEPLVAKRPSYFQRIVAWARREPGLACRLAVTGMLAALVQLRFMIAPKFTTERHYQILGLIFGWALMAVFCQFLMRRGRDGLGVILLWLASDVIFLTVLLILGHGFGTPLIIGYALFIAASGVWYRSGLVYISTAAACLGYVLLMIEANARDAFSGELHHHFFYLVNLLAIAMIVENLVRRSRLLSRLHATSTTRTKTAL